MRNIVMVGIESLIAFFFLSQGLYITTRDLPPHREQANWWKRPGLWGGMAMVLASWFFVSVAVQTTIPDKRMYILWNKAAWWTIPFAVASWYWAVVLLILDADKKAENNLPKIRPFGQATLLSMLLASAFAIAAAGVFTEFIFDYSGTQKGLRFEILEKAWEFETFYIAPNRPGHFLYIVFLSGGLGLCTFLLRSKSDSESESRRRQALKWLYRGTGTIALGAAVATILYAEWKLVPEQLGDSIAAVGLFLVGIGVVKHNALVEDQVVWEDLRRMALGVALIVLIYFVFTLVIFYALGLLSLPTAAVYLPPLLYFVILTHASSGAAGLLLDRVTLPPHIADYRFDLAQRMREIVTAADPINKLEADEKELPKEARRTRVRAQLPSEKQIIRAIKAQREGLLRQKTLVDIERRQWLNNPLKDLGIVQQAIEEYKQQLSTDPDAKITALAMRGFLEDFISKDFRPPGEEPYPYLTSEWIDYYLLYWRYVRGLKLEDVRDQLTPKIRPEDVPGSERTWRSWYEKAKERLGKRIYDAEIDFLLNQSRPSDSE